MKKFYTLLVAAFAFAQATQAVEQSGFLELGSASGTNTYTTTDGTIAGLNMVLDHDLSGGAYSFGYMAKLDSNYVVGGGYHKATVTGETGLTSANGSISGIPVTSTYNYKTVELSYSGSFGLFGYDVTFAETWHFIPQVRLGLSNSVVLQDAFYLRLQAPSIGYDEAATGTSKTTGSTNLFLIMLPLSYSFENMTIGYQLQLGGAGITVEDGTDKYVATIASASHFIFGFKF